MLEPKLLMQEPDNYYGSLFQRAEQQYKRFPINQMILDDIGNDKKNLYLYRCYILRSNS